MSYSYGVGYGGMPPAVRNLILINVAIFLAMALLPTPVNSFLVGTFGLVPAEVVPGGKIWQPATYMFLHSLRGIGHVFFNMFALWVFGTSLEQWWGSRQFVKYYFVTGIGAGIMQMIAAFIAGGYDPIIPIIGASGAVWGLMAAFAVTFPDRRIYLWFLVPIKARTFVILFGILELAMALQSPHGGVARWAHIGGALVGFVYLRYGHLLRQYRRMAGGVGGAVGGRRRPSHRDPVVSDEELRRREDERDRILDKIGREGPASLTPEERKFLEDAAERARRRQGH